MDYKDALKILNEKIGQHSPATSRTSDLQLSEGDYNQSSPSMQLFHQKHADKAKVTTRAAFNQGHTTANASNLHKPLGHLPTLTQLTAQAQAASLKTKK